MIKRIRQWIRRIWWMNRFRRGDYFYRLWKSGYQALPPTDEEKEWLRAHPVEVATWASADRQMEILMNTPKDDK